MKSLSLNRPHAIMMVGLPGSGKSFFAKQFADTFNAPYIDSRSLAAYSKDAMSSQAIAALMAKEIVKTGQTFVYEGSAESRTHRTEFARWVRSHGYQPFIVWVQTDAGSAKDRAQKMYDMSDDEYYTLAKKFSPPHSSETPVVISGKHTYATQAKIVLSHLSKDRREAASQNLTSPRSERTPTRNILVR